jgi:hypothetical protein
MVVENSTGAILQDMIDHLCDLVHVTDGGYCKLIDSLKVAARNLLNSSSGQQKKCQTPTGRKMARVIASPASVIQQNELIEKKMAT